MNRTVSVNLHYKSAEGNFVTSNVNVLKRKIPLDSLSPWDYSEVD
jgi:hypothetical protein